MKKTIFLLTLLLSLLPACSLEPEGAFFTVEGESYQYQEIHPSVLSGAYDGLEINFTQENDDSGSKLTLELPSTASFYVGENYPTFEYTIPELPFTLTEEDFTGLYSDRMGAEVLPHFYWNLYAFTDFEITVQEFEIDEEHRITMRADFTGSTVPDENSEAETIQGHFYFDKADLGIIDID